MVTDLAATTVAGRDQGRDPEFEFLLRATPGPQERQSDVACERRHRPDRAVRLRQDHAFAVLQPDARFVSRQPL